MTLFSRIAKISSALQNTPSTLSVVKETRVSVLGGITYAFTESSNKLILGFQLQYQSRIYHPYDD